MQARDRILLKERRSLKANSDGALFYIISPKAPDSATCSVVVQTVYTNSLVPRLGGEFSRCMQDSGGAPP